MLSALLAHQDALGIHDVWSRWNADPLLVVGLAAALWACRRGATTRRHARDPWRARCFWFGVAAVAVALLSPLDAMAAQLASAHMVQHIVLVLVAAPLLAYSAPMVTMLAGSPRFVRTSANRARRSLRSPLHAAAVIRRPAVAWLLHAATLWFWHASVPYGAALDDPLVHAIEHATFLGTGVLFWSTLRPARASASTLGHSVLLVFGMAMQSVFLAALLTFATTPWYAGYRETTRSWGMEPLADQQLAGVIMWVPAGLVYVAAGVLLVAAWVHGSARDATGGSVEGDWEAGSAPDRTPVTLR